MNYKIKTLLPVMVLSLLITSFSGCKIGDKDVYLNSGSGISNAFTIGDMKCPKKEANLYIGCFADYYGSVGGTDGKDANSISFDSDTLKKSAFSLMTRVYSLDLYASENDMKLSESEISYCDSAAGDFYSKMSEEDKQKIGVSEKDVKSAYERYALALKVYNSLMEGVDGNVTEDEARVMDGYVIYLSNGDKLKELETRIKGKDNFATLTQVYSEGSKNVVTFGRGTYPQSFDDAAFKLEDGEVSDRIETDDGYYFVQCVNKYDKEKSEINKLAIIDKRQRALLKQIESEQRDNYYTELNSTYFDEVSVPDLRVSGGKEFFSIIENHIDF